jgi:competence protein ComEC
LRRPAIGLIGAFWTGLVLAGALPLGLWVWTAVLVSLVALTLLAGNPRRWYLLFLGCTVVLGVLRSPEARWNRVQCSHRSGGLGKSPCIIKVRQASPLPVCGEPVKVRVESVAVGFGWLAGESVFLRGPGVCRALSGGATTALGTFYPPRPRLNPRGWDTASGYARRGVVGTVVAEAFTDSGGAMPLLGRLRGRIRRLIQAAGNDMSRGVLEALILGERSDLHPRIKDTMIRAGTYHVIAISGLHVGIVVLLVTSLITAAGPPRGMRILLAVVCVTGYVLFTGARPSTQRAGVFFVLMSLVRYLQWKVDLSNLVCAAGFILLVLSPHLAWDVGFRLSLAAVFGITLFTPQLQGAGGTPGSLPGRVKRYVRLGATVSFSAQAATLPILLYHFGRVSLIGILSNLVVMPVVTLAVAAGLEASVLSVFWERAALVFMRSASALVTFMVRLTSLFATGIDPMVFSGRPGVPRIIIYVIGIGYIGLIKSRLKIRWKTAGLILLYVFLACPIGPRSDSDLVLTFVHVGDGDACLVAFPGGGTMLVDTGTGSLADDAGRRDVLPMLATHGIKKVDAVIVTHSHYDHYGGLEALAANIDIGRLLVGTWDGESGYREVLEDCRTRGIEVDLIGRGDTLRYGDAVLEVLHPSRECLDQAMEDPNALSVTFRLVYGVRCILFTGDLTPGVQRELVGLGVDLSCDVLKVPHHGAPGGVDEGFAKACEADYAVISVGSRFASHPSAGTIGLLEKTGMLVLTTRNDGAVTVRTDGKGLAVRTEVRGRLDRPHGT